MSQIFWDQFLDLDDVHHEIVKIASSVDEKNELAQVVDEIVHHRMMTFILENLGNEHHDEFLVMFTKFPNDDNITEFLKSRIKNDFVTLIKLEVEKIRKEILSFLHLS